MNQNYSIMVDSTLAIADELDTTRAAFDSLQKPYALKQVMPVLHRLESSYRRIDALASAANIEARPQDDAALAQLIEKSEPRVAAVIMLVSLKNATENHVKKELGMKRG